MSRSLSDRQSVSGDSESPALRVQDLAATPQIATMQLSY